MKLKLCYISLFKWMKIEQNKKNQNYNSTCTLFCLIFEHCKLLLLNFESANFLLNIALLLYCLEVNDIFVPYRFQRDCIPYFIVLKLKLFYCNMKILVLFNVLVNLHQVNWDLLIGMFATAVCQYAGNAGSRRQGLSFSSQSNTSKLCQLM